MGSLAEWGISLMERLAMGEHACQYQAHDPFTHTSVTAEQTACLFLDNVLRLHGVLKTIVSDPHPHFMSHFWDV